MSKHLFYCNTPFQIMMATAFKMTELKDECVDIIVADLMNHSEALYKNICESKVFHKTYYIRNFAYDYERCGKIRRIQKQISRIKDIKKLIPDLDVYDYFYTTDSLITVNSIYEVLKKKNKGLKVFYYEEGPISVLCDQGDHFREKREYFSFRGKVKNLLLGMKYVNGSFSAAYSSVYDQMPDNYFEWRKLPVIPYNGIGEYVKVLNQFWDYRNDVSLQGKIIFLEESFYVDNRGNTDIKIIKDILENAHGREVLVKLHPRTRNNRFSELGLSVYNNASVPWELIALNGDLDDTILVSIASGAILYPKLYWNIEQKAIALIDCEDYRFPYLDNDYYHTYSKVCAEKQLANMPANKTEFIRMLGEANSGSGKNTERS